MRTYGRINQVNNRGGTWVEVTTDAAGGNSNVYLTALCQCIKLNLGESPFWSNLGIPAVQSVMTQVFPDVYVGRIQQYFSQFFASLSIPRVPGSNPPVYKPRAVCFNGDILETEVPT